MGVATATATPPLLSHSNNQISIIKGLNSLNSMSQGFHPAIYSTFSNGFDTPLAIHQDQDQTGELPAVYETGGMLSEMFSFQSGAAPAANLLDNQILESFRLHRSTAEWPPHNRHNIAQLHQIPAMNADSTAAMQLFLMKPQPRSPSPPPPPASFHSAFDANPIPPAQFTWITDSGGADSTNRSKIEGAVESQGLSLSLSPLQHLEVAKKAEELRIGDGAAVLYYNQGGGGGGGSSHHHFSNSFQLKNLETSHHLQGVVGQNHHNQVHVGFSPSLEMINVLRNSKYLKAAQELLEEICSVGRGQLKNDRLNTNPNKNTNSQNSVGGGGSSSSSKDLPPLSAADRIQYQRRKAALLSILDEVDRRYNHYCGQMQMVVNSFDSIMGCGAARPYTALAQKAMSRHFRYLKDAIAAQLKQTRELLGEKEGVGATGITKGETPRLKLLDQSLRQQRAFHQMGMMEQEAWRPQRGLPESSVNILRAWLFEHFLHPYPSDADKHLLARQTGLSRNQVSNWFINARVRLWKPMVEEMYQQESKDQEGDDGGGHGHEERDREKNKQGQGQGQSSSSAQTPTLSSSAATATTTTTAAGKRSEINAQDNDPSLDAVNIQRFSKNQAGTTATTIAAAPQHNNNSINMSSPTSRSYRLHDYHHHRQNQQLVIMSNHVDAHEGHYGTTTTPTSSNGANTNIVDSAALLMFGSSATTTPDHVSLTLGLRHAGNLPDNNRFPLTDYGSY